jgi:hypothetical protein
VQGVVDPPVSCPGEPVPDLVAGGHVDRRGAVIAGEGVLGGEPADVAGLGQDPPGDHRPDPEQRGQGRAHSGDQGSDLGSDVLEPGVQGADVGEQVPGDLDPDLADVIGRPDLCEQAWALFADSSRRTPPGVSSASSRCCRQTAWVRWLVSSSRRSHSSSSPAPGTATGTANAS